MKKLNANTSSGCYLGEVTVKLIKGEKPFRVAKNKNHATKEFLKFILKSITTPATYIDMPTGIQLCDDGGNPFSQVYPIVIPKEVMLADDNSAYVTYVCQIPYSLIPAEVITQGFQFVKLVSGKKSGSAPIPYAETGFSDIIHIEDNTSIYIEWKLTLENFSEE